MSSMQSCMYSAQGELICNRNQSLTKRGIEPFYAVNTTPNNRSSTGNAGNAGNKSKSNEVKPNDVVTREAIKNGCDVVYDASKGFSITNCNNKMSV